ncbi:MAG TPA: hypothetical protein DF383_07130 [Deltaproteobacteria bacterium]|nr:hypothetical protein [Deltaproteobacteria bacterium]
MQKTVHRSSFIVVAEDDEEMRKLLVGCLQKEGYRAMGVRNALELLDYTGPETALPSNPEPDLIISDIRMPGVTGLSFLEGLKSMNSPIPVIIITAFGSPEIHQEALRLGAAAVFDKPFDMDHLKESVKEILGGDE